MIQKYIIVDDDDFNNAINRKLIENALGKVDVTVFSVPEIALSFIGENYKGVLEPTVLFLDINMPTMTGWDFMERFERFSDTIKDQFTVYIVSSSLNKRNRDKAKANTYIKGYFPKLLKLDTIVSISAN